MKNYLDTIRKPVDLPLMPGEEVILYYSASYDIGSSIASSWRLGNLYLTNIRLLFVQGKKILFKVLHNQIKTVSIVTRGWVLGKKVKQLYIVAGDRKFPFIAIKDPEIWTKAIEEWATASKSTSFKPQSTAPKSPLDEVIIMEKGCYLTPGHSWWKPGNLFLTHRNLAFHQESQIEWEIPLNEITDLRVEKKIYGISQSDTIRIEYESLGELSELWIIIRNLDTWRKELYVKTLLKVDHEIINKIVAELDPGSREILWFLYENRHADIDKLAKLIEAPTHMYVLFKIREIINPTAEDILGCPILSFESSKVDWVTGEKITFSWWLTGRPQKEVKEPLLDIFDEGANLIIYLELLDIKEDALKLRVVSNKLIIDAEKNYHKEISLPVMVNEKRFTKKYKNNILQIRLKKTVYLSNKKNQ